MPSGTNGMKSAVNQGMNYWWSDPAPPSEWHCDSGSEEEEEEDGADVTADRKLGNDAKESEVACDNPDFALPKVSCCDTFNMLHRISYVTLINVNFFHILLCTSIYLHMH